MRDSVRVVRWFTSRSSSNTWLLICWTSVRFSCSFFKIFLLGWPPASGTGRRFGVSACVIAAHEPRCPDTVSSRSPDITMLRGGMYCRKRQQASMTGSSETARHSGDRRRTTGRQYQLSTCAESGELVVEYQFTAIPLKNSPKIRVLGYPGVHQSTGVHRHDGPAKQRSGATVLRVQA